MEEKRDFTPSSEEIKDAGEAIIEGDSFLLRQKKRLVCMARSPKLRRMIDGKCKSDWSKRVGIVVGFCYRYGRIERRHVVLCKKNRNPTCRRRLELYLNYPDTT